MANAKQKAIELINDSLQLQPPHDDFKRCYVNAKLCALYIALAVRRTHDENSYHHKFYYDVKLEIEKL